jgi:hypothetical protein
MKYTSKDRLIAQLIFLCLNTYCLTIFGQKKFSLIANIDSICFTNNVSRCYIIDNGVYATNAFETALKNSNEQELINTNDLKQSGLFEELQLLAVYDLNNQLIRLDGYEQRSNCGIQYKWYFDNLKLSAVVQTRYGFKNATDNYQNTRIKETFVIEGKNWIGKRDIQIAGKITNEKINSWNESLVNMKSNQIISFVIPSIYSFDSNSWTDANATNFDLTYKKGRYYYNCPNESYKIKGLLYVGPDESAENEYSSNQIRFLISGGKIRFPQYLNYQNIESVDETAFKKAQNGLIKVDSKSFCLDWLDVNFDGIKDIKLYSAQTDCYYVYNSEDRQFEYFPLLRGNQIEGLEVNSTEKKLFWNSADDSEESLKAPKKFFIWDNGYLRRMF